jgi:biopolymer transport protein ExbD
MEIPRLQAKRRARLEIVPLIDIIFFLLATFVLVSLSMVKNKGIPVVLPKASSGESTERAEHVVVAISDAGQFYLDKRELPEAELFAELARLKSANPELKVFIHGDENARLGLAIAVLDQTRRIGISKVTFETNPAKR